ncbi:DNA-directed RNA polymerase subunit omega [bacterium]|nr:DNA-directed RNA polymerase subunit omega [bacterium]
MARVTIEDCLSKINNRFALVILAAKRTRMLLKGADPKIESDNKLPVIALREIAAGYVRFTRDVEEELRESFDEFRKVYATKIRKPEIDATLL